MAQELNLISADLVDHALGSSEEFSDSYALCTRWECVLINPRYHAACRPQIRTRPWFDGGSKESEHTFEVEDKLGLPRIHTRCYLPRYIHLVRSR